MHQNLETTEKIWKAVRRPSDMVRDLSHCESANAERLQNDYARQIRELQAREKPGKTAGRVFVKGM